MKKRLIVFVLSSVVVIVLAALICEKVKAEPYVIYHENQYIILNYKVKPELIGEEIAVAKNGSASKNKDGYSNALKDGTRLYAIIGEDADVPKAIAYKNNEYRLLILPDQRLDLSGYIEEPDPFIPNKNEEQ